MMHIGVNDDNTFHPEADPPKSEFATCGKWVLEAETHSLHDAIENWQKMATN